eukprot:TRINITY_DN19309_c0_g1_i1.p1 TRINITY_DN19309_c0_g1~~TRINITY_DN19309_c0_g1_i1.p1  ORF type:complete len:740 (-),score=130.61 TRINITY_DN19309_c0_g1_i1:357-2576(-)
MRSQTCLGPHQRGFRLDFRRVRVRTSLTFCLLFVLLLAHSSISYGKIIFITKDGKADAEPEGEADTPEEGEEDNPVTLRIPLNLIKGEDGVLRLQQDLVKLIEADQSEAGLEYAEWDEFGTDLDEYLDLDLDVGGWKSAVDEVIKGAEAGHVASIYTLGVKQLLGAPGVQRNVVQAMETLSRAAEEGHPHAQSVLAYLHASGYGVPLSEAKAFMYHTFAAKGGSFQSKMALAYSYLRQQEFEKAAELYGEVAAKTVVTNHVLQAAPLVETVRLSSGGEESHEAVRGHRGEDDETIQYMVYSAWNGNPDSQRTLGNLYYWGARGLPRDLAVSAEYFRKAADQGDPLACVHLGEMYTRGAGVEKTYEQAIHWLHKALDAGNGLAHLAASNGLGYLHARGFGVPQNYTRALELFMMAASRADSEGQYYLGVMHLHGLGVKKSAVAAMRFFVQAADKSHLASVYQLARMNQKGIGTRQNFHTASILYKAVAERGTWGTVLRWAHSRYMEGDVGTALLLYSRAAELGYEVAQSNAAWLLDKYRGESGCVGPSGGKCSEYERHERAHRLWRHASEQGNVQAALLIGDAYFYGRGTQKDLERAVEAYRRAKDKRNAQATFNLGYMHEHGLGLPRDLHLAKRFYDEALETDPDAALPCKLALAGLWLRTHHEDSILVKLIDNLPDLLSRFFENLSGFVRDEGNIAIATLSVCLIGVLFLLRQRQLRQQQEQRRQEEQIPSEQQQQQQ